MCIYIENNLYKEFLIVNFITDIYSLFPNYQSLFENMQNAWS